MLKKADKILITGARGMVGSAVTRTLQAHGFHNLLTPSHAELDCCEQTAVREYFRTQRPNVVLVAAAKVGGIWANLNYPAEFLYSNLLIGAHIIHEAHLSGVERLLYLGSSCVYPREAPQPISEEALLSGPLERSNEAYALAKIAGIKMCDYYRRQYQRSFISAMPTNLYGPNDTYHPENSHVIPALMHRFHTAKVNHSAAVSIWGQGEAKREFLYIDDLAEAVLHLLEHYDEPGPINIGSHEELSIRELAEKIADIVGFSGAITHDLTKPEGTPRKKTDLSRISALGWAPTISLTEGLKKTYTDFLTQSVNSKNFY